MRRTLVLAVALIAMIDGVRANDDDEAQFVGEVAQCASAPHDTASADAKYRRCLEDTAYNFAYNRYQSEAYVWFFSDFEQDYPDNFIVIASAKHWKDFRGFGPESLEYIFKLMLPRGSNARVARLKRVRGPMIPAQIGAHLNQKLQLRRRLAPFLSLKPTEFFAEWKKIVTSLDTSLIAVDELQAHEANCPALAQVDRSLRELDWPRPLPPPAASDPRKSPVVKVVIHPHVVVLRVPGYPLTITIEDAGMEAVYRWATNAVALLEPCWRPRK